jgi:hypothetical protein
VPDGFQQLIDDRHRWGLERRHTGLIENEPATRAGEKCQYNRMLGQDPVLEDLGGVAVQLEHRGIQL